MEELQSVYSRSFNNARAENAAEDVIGIIQLEFIDWDKRRPAAEILEDMRQLTADIPGIQLEFRKAPENRGRNADFSNISKNCVLTPFFLETIVELGLKH